MADIIFVIMINNANSALLIDFLIAAVAHFTLSPALYFEY